MALDTNQLYAYKLDGSSVDTISGANNGSDTNITYSSGNGKLVQGAGFGGLTSTIQLPNNDWSATAGYSIQAWIKTSSTAEQQIVCRDNGSGAGRLFQLRMEATTGKIGFIRFDGSTNVVTNLQSSASVNDGNWHHVIETFDTTSGSVIYIDGSSSGTDANTTANRGGTSSIPYIGSFDNSTSFWSGAIDEVYVWNRALTGSEVTSLYNSGTGVQYPYSVAGLFDSLTLLGVS